MWFKHKGQDYGIPFALIESQKLTFEEISELVSLHKDRIDLQKILIDTKDVKLMKILFHQLTELEFEIQMMWGFQPDIRKHHSYRWPKCSCPFSDNKRMPEGLMWVTLSCPLHGEEIYSPKPKKRKQNA